MALTPDLNYSKTGSQAHVYQPISSVFISQTQGKPYAQQCASLRQGGEILTLCCPQEARVCHTLEDHVATLYM